jgi:hypothetical protein
VTDTALKSAVLMLALAAPLAACGSMVPTPPPATMGHCPLGYHTEAFPNNPDPRRAYQCWSDRQGYLRRPGDEDERMAPYSGR